MKTHKPSPGNRLAVLSLLCLVALMNAFALLRASEEVVSADGPRRSAESPRRGRAGADALDHPAGVESRVGEELSDCEMGDKKFVGLPPSLNLGRAIFRPRLEHPRGWIYPAGIASPYCGYCTWRCQNPDFGNKFHLAQDMCNFEGDPVYAIDYGEVIHSQCVGEYGGPSGGTCGGAIAIQHRAKDGTWFTALYGHLDNYLPVGARVYAGDVVGFSNNWSPPHVHFGVRMGVDPDPANWFRGYTPDGNNFGFTNPNVFLDSFSPCKNGTSVNYRPDDEPPVHPNGTLVRSISDPTGTVYLLRNGQKQGIVSPQVLRNLYPNGGFDFKDVIVVAQDELERYPTGPAISSQLPSNGKTHSEGRLIKKNPGGEISIVTDNGMRRAFVSADVFLNLGYLFCNVADATAANYDSYTPGPPITGAPTTTQCNYEISPTSRTFASGGGSGPVSVTAGAGCGWTAASDASWLTITSGSSGSGNGTVNYSVAANSGSQRSGVITVSGGGQNRTHTVTQSGGVVSQNPTPGQISDYADQLSLTYKVPSVVVKAMLEQESGWRQFDAGGNPVIRNEPDGRIGIGLTQVTVTNTSFVTLSLGVIQPGAQGSNPFTTATQPVSVDVNRLKTDWQYNMEVGVRVLVAKKVSSAGAGDDAGILENWYYPLAYYNGAVKGGANDPNNSSYSRVVASGGDWVSVSKFPYQERVFNIIAQLYPIPTARRSFYGNPIKVTLPGPSAVGSGAGQYAHVEPAFCFFDWAIYFDTGVVHIGNWGNQNNGCIPTAKTRTGIAFHKVQFGAPSSIPSPPTAVSPGTASEPGAPVSTTTPTFEWGAGAGAASYSLFISRSPYGSANIVYSNTNLTGASFTLPAGVLVNGERYRWNMTASNAAGESGVSNTLYFNVSTPVTTRTLTVASSNPASGVSIGVSPNDNNGAGGGVTQFTRTYNDNTVVSLTAPATAAGNNFQKWQRNGVDLSSNRTVSVSVNASLNLTAVYTSPPPTISVSVQTSPPGLSYTVDGSTFTTPQTFSWAAGSSHTIGTLAQQDGGPGTRYVWDSWSDGGGLSHTVSPTSNGTFVANFAAQHFLTVNAGAGGVASPPSGWYGEGQGVTIQATSNPGFAFGGWSGIGNGSYSGPNNPASLTMHGPISESASFTPVPTPTPTNSPTPTPTPSLNLALNKPAVQSSDLFGGVAARAVDGNTSGAWSNNSVTHTGLDAQAWWQVDLGGVQSIRSVRVWNRTDSFPERLSNFYVLVSDVPFASTSLSATLAQAGVSAFHTSAPAGSPTSVAVNRTGRYVRVQLAETNYLTIGEVEVLGSQAPPTSMNLAQGKAATQSSDLVGGVASRAVDGNTSGAWSSNSVTHTDFDTQAWWQVDLGAVQSVNEIKVFNRTDCCSERLSDFYVFISDVPFVSADVTTTLNQAGVSSYRVDGPAGAQAHVAVARSGRYVRVQLNAPNYLSLAEVQVWGSPSALTNLALNKAATQSSDPFGAPAARAVDGNTSGVWSQNSVSHTGNDAQAWWQVDLGQVRQLDTVRVWNRTDCCSERLSNFYVLVSDVPFVSNDLTAARNQAGVSSFNVPGIAGAPTSVAVNRSGRYVRVQLSGANYLMLAEVEVFGGGLPLPVHLAQGKPAVQSSDLFGGVAARAVDGNTSGAWSNNSVTHTGLDAQAWWQVDLGGVQSIRSVRVWNRTDSFPERLSNFYVLVSDTPFASTDLTTALNQPGVSSYFTPGAAGVATELSVNRTGRYVRVQLAGTGYLSLAEVQVWAPVTRPATVETDAPDEIAATRRTPVGARGRPRGRRRSSRIPSSLPSNVKPLRASNRSHTYVC
jgi:hypothetical protein